MKINQLFTRVVDIDILNNLVRCLGLSDVDDPRTFTRYDLRRVNAVARVTEMVPVLQTFYIPCKARLYLTDITEKKVVTIVKQVLRLHGYCILAKEKNVGTRKVIMYRVVNTSVDAHGMHQTFSAVSLGFD